MKRVFAVILGCVVLVSSCLETSTNTTIKEDGSGIRVAIVDMSKAMEMAMQGKKPEPNDQLYMDTAIQMRNHSDTASVLNARQKDLLRGMVIRFRMDFRDAQKTAFTVAIEAPFKNLDDLNELNTLVTQKEYDIVFDRAFKIPMFDDKDKDGSIGSTSDNLFGSVFPAFFKCNYTRGKISCEVDSVAYGEALGQLRAMEFDLNGEMESKMFGASTFTNTLLLPSAPKNISGGSWKKGSNDNMVVQGGTLLEIYKEPGKFTYTIQY
jgi:hypothetical protein